MAGSALNLQLEEYKLCEASRHHHERTMWQLLGFYLAVTGVLLQFWLSSDPFTEVDAESSSFLILFVPLFLGIFTGGALLKHKFFWRLEHERAIALETPLGFHRERDFRTRYYSNPIRYFRSGEMAFIAVVLTVAGVAYLIGRSFWFKPPTAPGGTYWFPWYAASIPLAVTLYFAYRKVRVGQERAKAGAGTEFPPKGSPKRDQAVRVFLAKVVVGVLGSLTLGVSLQWAFVKAGNGASVLEAWIFSTGGAVSAVLILGLGVAAFRSLLLDLRM